MFCHTTVTDPKKPKPLLAVLNQHRSVVGSLGVIVSLHSSDAAAVRAKSKTAHARVVQLKRPLAVNDHVFGIDIVPADGLRWGR